ncbi:MAG: DUF1501 domain-containing protein [Planctomycetia bacterium]|nr:DUF1501 domain-containing protein [Planctomycetia bacterium]
MDSNFSLVFPAPFCKARSSRLTVSTVNSNLTLLRRRFLQLSAGSLGLSLGGLWRAQAAAPSIPAKSIRACILVFYYGGPSHIDSFDPKPNAPAEVRGEFKTVRTTVPGTVFSEHVPNLARIAHKIAVVRSVTHAARLHDSASIHALTGRPLDGPDRELFAPLPQFYPSYGSAVAHCKGGREIPFASLPFTFRNVHPVPCQGAGILGPAHDPLHVIAEPNSRTYRVESLQPNAEVDTGREQSRKLLLESLDRTGAESPFRDLYSRAYRLMESEAIRGAVDIAREPEKVRAKYGAASNIANASTMRGQNLLIARRLVEAGAQFVNVYDFQQQGQNWDSHANNFQQLREHLLPPADRSLAALIEDLDARGLLDSTLVVAMGEFGRTPRINGTAGRDHWPDCYSVLLAGGGIVGGAVYGSSDKIGALPATDPVTPGDLAATIFQRFGIDPGTEIRDPTARPHRLATGDPIVRLFRG